MTKTAKTYTFFIIYILLNAFIPYFVMKGLSGYIENPITMNIFLQLSLFIPVVLIGLKMVGEPVKNTLSIKKISGVDIIVAAVLPIAITPIINLLSLIMMMFCENNVKEALNIASESSLILSIISLCIIPAIFEEIIFRGIIFSGLKNVGLEKACIIGGLLFGIAHFDPQQILYTFIIGSLFCYIVYRTKSIFPTMIIHFIINFTSVMASRVELPAETAEVAESMSAASLIPSYLMLSLLALPIVLYLVSMLGRKYGRGKPLFNRAEGYVFKIDDESAFDYAPQKPFEENIFSWQLVLIAAAYILIAVLL